MKYKIFHLPTATYLYTTLCTTIGGPRFLFSEKEVLEDKLHYKEYTNVFGSKIDIYNCLNNTVGTEIDFGDDHYSVGIRKEYVEIIEVDNNEI